MEKYKKTYQLLLGLVILLGLGLLIGCPVDDDSVSVSERISRFESAINAGGANAGNHIHPAAPGADQADTAAYWQSYFPTDRGEVYSIGSPSSLGSDVYETTINGGTFVSNDRLRFTMREDGSDNWKINRIEQTGSISRVIFPES